MKGQCEVCGCTVDSACRDDQTQEPCFWVDEREDLCSQCALGFVVAAPPIADLRDADRAIRSLRLTVMLQREELASLTLFVADALDALSERVGLDAEELLAEVQQARLGRRAVQTVETPIIWVPGGQ
jgi:hypothetical protein